MSSSASTSSVPATHLPPDIATAGGQRSQSARWRPAPACPARAALWACLASVCILAVWCVGTWRADACATANAAGTACSHGRIPASPRQGQHKASKPEHTGFSSWMTDNEAALAHRTLHDVTLPGSHDSASFYLDRKIMPGSLPWPLNDIVQVATDIGVSTADYIIKWSQSQTLDIAEQLNAGVRYFDLRAGFNGSHWVACHTLSGAPLFPMIMQLATFLGQYPREVVVVELTHVYNADDEVLDVLREILNCLGLVMDDECRWTQTFQERWEHHNRAVLVTNVKPRPQDRWCHAHAIENSYANSDDIEEMWRYNERLVESFVPQDGRLFKISWTLTPHLITMARGLFEPPSTLKALADVANAELPAFVDDMQRHWNHSGFPQLLIADDFVSAMLLPTVLELNGLPHG